MIEVVRLARQVWPMLLVLVALELVGAGLAVLAPVPLQTALDVMILHRKTPYWLLAVGGPSRLAALCGVGLLLTILSQGQSLASGVLSTGVGQRLIRVLRERLFAAALRLSLTRHIERGTTDTVFRIQSDAQAVEWFLLDGALPTLTAVVTLGVMLTALFRLNVSLGLIGAFLAPLLLLAGRTARPALKSAAREAKQRESEALGLVQTSLGALTTVKAFGIEDRLTALFVETAEKGVRLRCRIALMDGVFGAGVQTLCAVGTALALYIGVGAAERGVLSVGQVLLGLHYLQQVYSPLKTLGKKWASLQTQFAGLERATALLHEPTDVPENPDPFTLTTVRGALSFNQVSFGYDPRRTVLRDVTLRVAPGERLGVIGETGSGKSTLLSLLLRLYDPTAGSIKLDGIDLRDLSVATLRKNIGIVFQETVLLPGTVAENIAVGKPGATPAEIEAAARAAQLHETVCGFPDGYATRVGERGAALSGGERQRVGLARAFLRDAPILLLDEPTSALDQTTELDVLEALDRLMVGRTVIIVTHRESALRSVDRVVHVIDGTLRS